jgi:ACT domain-containing protein
LQISLKLEMKDKPGQLVEVLQPISELGGNIIAVIHEREPGTSDEYLEIQIVLAIQDSKVDMLLDRLRAKGANIMRLGKERLLHRSDIVMIGHLLHTDLTDTVDQIDRTGVAEVTELSIVMPGIDEPSSARITIKAISDEELGHAMDILRKVASEKDLLIIEPLEDGI